MGKVKRIFLVRHGQSLGNVDQKVHHEIADHAIPLSAKGHDQARAAGAFLRDYFDTLDVPGDPAWTSKVFQARLWNSPYKRTRQTADEIQGALGAVTLDGPRGANTRVLPRILDRRENIVLCEQQFGLFDGHDFDELPGIYPDEYAHYKKCEDFEGRFWARMPMGESRFDVSVRVHQIFGTWHRDAERHDVENLVVVSHGVTIRAIVMRWLHFGPDWFEQERNPKNCSIRLLENGEDKGYIYKGG